MDPLAAFGAVVITLPDIAPLGEHLTCEVCGGETDIQDCAGRARGVGPRTAQQRAKLQITLSAILAGGGKAGGYRRNSPGAFLVGSILMGHVHQAMYGRTPGEAPSTGCDKPVRCGGGSIPLGEIA